jgi:hypothetical protein
MDWLWLTTKIPLDGELFSTLCVHAVFDETSERFAAPTAVGQNDFNMAGFV